MRKLPLFLLLASTAAMPALAAPGDHDRGGRHNRDSQSEQSDDRAQRSEKRQERAAERPQAQPEQRRQADTQRVRSVDGQQGSDRHERMERRFEQNQQQKQRVEQAQQQQQRVQRQRTLQAQAGQSARSDRTREWRQRNGTTNSQSNWQARERRVRTIPDTNAVRGPSRAEREAFQNRNRRDYRDGNYTRWTNNWRHDRRYDWNSYRNHNRTIFRIGNYYDPFGWNYRRWSIGAFMYPSYYGSNYWLNDPWQYRLPPAYGPYRWVRYWNDALLVNIYTGQVEDVLNNFFW